MRLRLAADLSTLFLELPEPARFGAAQAAGFSGISLSAPYDGPVQDLRDRLVMNGLVFASMQAPPPNYTGVPPGFAAAPGGQERFQRDFKRMARYADVLKPAAVELRAGPKGDFATLVENLRWACDAAPKRVFAMAPYASGDFLTGYDQLAEVLDAVAQPNLGLVLDTCEAVALGTEPMALWERFAPQVKLIRLAAAPDRAMPGSDGLDLKALFKQVAKDKFKGWISADYVPKLTTAAELSWLSAGKK
ncbi:hydroxypyruvate isomerase [Rhodobacter sp. JA431]|uniref:TIM barrel protein n=1 Tax=Rhodobacter sp. JA431 TaxID=570013 RepID=UPI000BD7E6AB|nr:TIM barrel protein [Rhodobacter sp. JA431]SOC16177.1 hydroxypyruvate isomerase [Rhodobacter sp. JA431]